MQMPSGVPDYAQFMKMSVSQRKNLLKILKFFSGKQLQPLLMVVYEKDPDAEVRQTAREMLESQGVKIRVEGDNLPEDAERQETPAWMQSVSSPIQNTTPDVGIPVTDDLSRRAVEALKRGQGIPQSADLNTPKPPSQSLADSGATIYYTTEGGTFESPFSGPDTITGGDGRAMQRNQSFPQVFLLHPKNQKYLHGETEKPTTGGASPITVLIIFVIFFGFFFGLTGFFNGMSGSYTTASRMGMSLDGFSFSGMFVPFILIFAVVFVIMVIADIRTRRRMSHLAANGKVLVGQASMIQGRWVSSGSGKSRSRSYKVTVSYSVRIPEGITITGQQTATRGDLARKTLPVPGTPIAVLYVNDEEKMLL